MPLRHAGYTRDTPRLSLLLQVNDAGGALIGHGEAQHAVLHGEFLGFLVGGVRRVAQLRAVHTGNVAEVAVFCLESTNPEGVASSSWFRW